MNDSKKYIFMLSLIMNLFLFAYDSLAQQFNTNAIEPEPDWGVNMGSLAWGDFDNDGDPDLAVAGWDARFWINGGMQFRVYKNKGNGTFDPEEITPAPDYGLRYCSLAWGDYDNDGDLDLAVIGQDSNAVNRCQVHVNKGDGTFEPDAVPVKPNWGLYYACLAWGDCDNDGDLDLAVTGTANSGAKRFLVFKNNGDGSFDPDAIEPEANWGVVDGCLAWGDYDNDGDLDLAVAGYDGTGINGKRFRIYRNNGDGTFNSEEIEPEPGWGVSTCSLAWGDYDSDGDLDLAVAGYDGTAQYAFRFRIYRNNGDGTFDPDEIEPQPDWGLEYASLAWGDYDNDGDLDLVITGQDPDLDQPCRLYENKGNDTFQSNTIFADKGINFLAWIDCDNDGDLDLAGLGANGVEGFIFQVYKNLETTVNHEPDVPRNMRSGLVNDCWHLSWDQSGDDHTDPDIIRYQIAIGTNSGIYDYASTNLNHASGQANLGKVTIVTGRPCYQTKVSVSNKVYWKVCAIDSAFKKSAYCREQVGTTVLTQPQWVSALARSTNRIDLTWHELPGASTYTLFRSLTNDINTCHAVGTTSGIATNYNDIGLLKDTVYYYWLKAYNDLTASEFSLVISNRTLLYLDTTPPRTVADYAGGVYTGEVVVRLTAEDDLSGVDKVYYTLDGSDPKESGTVKTGTSPEDIRIRQSLDLRYYSQDKAGNKEKVKQNSYMITAAPDKIAVYPNYCDLSRDQVMRIVFGLEDNAEITVYNAAGFIVKRFNTRKYKAGSFIEWDGTSNEGNKLAAGVYVIAVRGQTLDERMKVILVK